jgi:hypothetical protein
MTEDEAVALVEARNRMPGSGRWFAQRLPDGSWRAVRLVADTVLVPAGTALGAPPVAPHPQPVTPLVRPEWGL